MTEVNNLENGRAKLSLDFDDEDNYVSEKAETEQKIRKISKETGFVSRVAIEPKQEVAANKELKPINKRRTRAKTGRTYPFNTKIKPETYDMICLIADTATEEEGRPVSLAEVIERSIAALEEKRKTI